MQRRYGRAQFLRDAVSLGLPTHLAFSRTALRRQRDQLIREHHPDRGGNNEKAREINEIYARMIRWLDSRYKPGSLPADDALLDKSEPETTPAKHSRLLQTAATATLWAASVIASAYVASRKRRRP